MTEATQNTVSVNDELIERMFKAGAHFGYAKARRHPSMKPYIFGAKNKVEIFDLEKTKEILAKTLAYVEELGRLRKTLMFISGKREGKTLIHQAASSISMPYVAGRWIGGTFTNFPEIRKRVDMYLDLTSKREKGELSKYTKKERLIIDRKIENLEIMFSGIVSLKKLPDAVYVIDAEYEAIAVTEAHKAGIPVVAVMNSDCNLSKAEYPIIANDASLSSITFFTNEVVSAYKRGLKVAAPVSQGTEAVAVSVKA